MKVLVACEYSGRVRDAFIAKGHDAMSCDLLPTDSSGPHYQGSIFDLDLSGFDLLIAHPPCTYLTLAGARWFYDPDDKSKPHPKYPNRWQDRLDAIEFFKKLQAAPVKKKAIENSQPLGYVMDRIGRYTQKVQPWMFGSKFTKGVCLWLEGLEPLQPTHNKPEIIIAKCHKETPGPDRWKKRSTTDLFIASAMAEQWG